MKTRLHLLAISVLIFNASIAKAELPTGGLENSLSSILQLIENLAFSGGSLVGLSMGACIPSVVPHGLNSIDMKFTSSATCPINGTVRLGVLPLTASLHLEFVNLPMVQSVDADFTATIRPSGGGLITQWNLINGHLAFRVLPMAPISDWYLTGAGVRQRTFGSGLQINSRFNVYNPTSGKGYAFNRVVKRKLFGGSQNQNTTCTLADAVATDPMSGTLSNCH